MTDMCHDSWSRKLEQARTRLCFCLHEITLCLRIRNNPTAYVCVYLYICISCMYIHICIPVGKQVIVRDRFPHCVPFHVNPVITKQNINELLRDMWIQSTKEFLFMWLPWSLRPISKRNLNTHVHTVQSMHERVRYFCDSCDYKYKA